MRNDGFEVHDLDQVVRVLTGGAETLNGMADGAPDAPDAAGSSAGVAGAMASIATAAAGIVRSAAVASERVAAGSGTYRSHDDSGRNVFGAAGLGGVFE